MTFNHAFRNLLACLALMAGVKSVAADDGKTEGTRSPQVRTIRPAGPAVVRNHAFHTPADGMGSDAALFPMNADEVQKNEFNDVIAIAQHMYDMTEAEVAGASKVMTSAILERWSSAKGGNKLRAILDRRARLYSKLLEGFPADASPGEVAKLVTSNSDFNRFSRSIDSIEDGHAHSFSAFVDTIESVLPPDKVAMAASEWAMRADSIPSETIHLKTLLTNVRAGSYEAMRGGASAAPNTARLKGADGNAPQPVGGAADFRQKQMTATGQPDKKDDGATGIAEPPTVALGGGADKKSDQANRGRPAVTRKPAAAKPDARRSAPRAAVTKAPPARPLNEWEKYVLEFIAKYELSTTQRNAAMAILRDMTARAQQIQSANADRIKAAESMTDARAKTEKLKELNEPIGGLFERMKLRLENLLTAAQREMAEKKPAGRR